MSTHFQLYLKVVYLLVFLISGLQVPNVLNTIFARTIKGLQGLGEDSMLEQAFLEAINESSHGVPVLPGCRQSPVTHRSNILAICVLGSPQIVLRKNMTALRSLLVSLHRFFLVLFQAHLAIVVKGPKGIELLKSQDRQTPEGGR